MKILVMSCDKNEDLFLPFYHCMEKYWPDHPEVIYCTETIKNPYYKTVFKNYPLNQWTKRVRETVSEIDGTSILLMCDDLFLTDYVNTGEFNKLAYKLVLYNLASINLQANIKDNWKKLDDQLLLMPDTAKYKTSVMCSLWDKNRMLDVFSPDLDPWKFEAIDSTLNYCRLSNIIMKWGAEIGGEGRLFGVFRGKWVRETVDFLINEGLNIDFSLRGYYD